MVICNLTATFDLSTFCRVFSDGGNFSTDEVDEYRKKLVREIFAVLAVQLEVLAMLFTIFHRASRP